MPPRWRFEYNYGQATTFYDEKQPSIVFEDTNIEQVSDRHEFIWQYFLAPPWLDFSIAGTLTGAQVNETDPVGEGNEFQYVTAYTNLGANIPISDFWSIKLIFEYFYTSMLVEDDAFGFRNLRGSQIYPEIEWLPFGSDMFTQISPYFRVPLWSDVGGREETTVGIKLKFPFSGKGLRFPAFAYQKAIILRVFYTEMNLEFQREDFIPAEIQVRQYGASIGFNF